MLLSKSTSMYVMCTLLLSYFFHNFNVEMVMPFLQSSAVFHSNHASVKYVRKPPSVSQPATIASAVILSIRVAVFRGGMGGKLSSVAFSNSLCSMAFLCTFSCRVAGYCDLPVD